MQIFPMLPPRWKPGYGRWTHLRHNQQLLQVRPNLLPVHFLLPLLRQPLRKQLLVLQALQLTHKIRRHSPACLSMLNSGELRPRPSRVWSVTTRPRATINLNSSEFSPAAPRKDCQPCRCRMPLPNHGLSRRIYRHRPIPRCIWRLLRPLHPEGPRRACRHYNHLAQPNRLLLGQRRPRCHRGGPMRVFPRLTT